MMDHYCDLRVLPNPEIAAHQVMNALFDTFHLALVKTKRQDIGISFPDVKDKSLGSRMRMHGSDQRLRDLLSDGCLKGVQDYIELSPIKRVPPNVQYRQVTRIQAKSNPERLRRRLMRRKGIGPEEAAAKIPESIAKVLDLPYLQISSRSTGQCFRLFVKHGSIEKDEKLGLFNSYGLSNGGTIPWF